MNDLATHTPSSVGAGPCEGTADGQHMPMNTARGGQHCYWCGAVYIAPMPVVVFDAEGVRLLGEARTARVRPAAQRINAEIALATWLIDKASHVEGAE